MPAGFGSANAQHWNLPGNLPNWLIGVERKVWGLKEHFRAAWTALKPGDVLFFYVAAPVRGVIGVGRVTAKFRDETPLWPDEIETRTTIYPLRFEFEITNALDTTRWPRERVPAKDLGVVIQSIGRIPPETASRLLARTAAAWAQPSGELLVAAEPKSSLHEQTKELLVDVGRMNRYLAEEEYPLDHGRLDVVWKRVEKSVPAYAFEVQVAGDIQHALVKLRHAAELWNSRIYLAADTATLPRVETLLKTSFHDLHTPLGILELEKLGRLQKALSAAHALEAELGLR
jgi:hypothetical protein